MASVLTRCVVALRCCSYRDSLSSSVLDAFAEKISAAEEATAQTDALLQDKLAAAAEAADVAAVRAAASLSGGTAGGEEGGWGAAGSGDGGSAEQPDHSAMAALMGVGVGAVGAVMAGALAGTAVAAKPALGLAVWPRMRRSSAADDDEGAAGRQRAGVGGSSGAGGGGLAAGGSMGPSQQASQVWSGSAEGGAAAPAAAARRMSSSGGASKQQAAAAAAPAAGAASGSGSGSGAGGKGGDPLECYSMFKMFAADDDSLDYSGTAISRPGRSTGLFAALLGCSIVKCCSSNHLRLPTSAWLIAVSDASPAACWQHCGTAACHTA